MQRRGDGFGRSVAAKHVTLQHTAVFITRHEGKIPEKTTHTHTHSGLADGQLIMCPAGKTKNDPDI